MKRTVEKLSGHVAREARGIREEIADIPEGEAELEYVALVLRDAIANLRAARNRIETAKANYTASAEVAP